MCFSDPQYSHYCRRIVSMFTISRRRMGGSTRAMQKWRKMRRSRSSCSIVYFLVVYSRQWTPNFAPSSFILCTRWRRPISRHCCATIGWELHVIGTCTRSRKVDTGSNLDFCCSCSWISSTRLRYVQNRKPDGTVDSYAPPWKLSWSGIRVKRYSTAYVILLFKVDFPLPVM